MKLAEKEYNKSKVIQDCNFESDFDKEVKKIANKLNRFLFLLILISAGEAYFFFLQ